MSRLITSKQRRQIREALSHPLKALHEALPSRSRSTRIARSTGLAVLATATRKHPLILTAATVAALGLGWWYYKRQQSSDDIQPSADAQRCDCSDGEEENKRRAKGSRNARAKTANDEASADAQETEEDAVEADAHQEGEPDAPDVDDSREH